MKVSVLLTTYNHERYVARALDSVLSQETSFPFEIVVMEDCSTDRTREIVAAYARRYADRIRLILSGRNLCDNGNLMRAYETSSAEYVALLDGDDYWTSPEKLQKQVAFLDAHPECSMSFHDALMFWDDGSRPPESFNHPETKPRWSLEELLAGNLIAGPSPLLRRVLPAIPEWYRTFVCGDWPLYLLHLEHGDAAYLPEVLAAYRVHAGGYWSGLPERGQLEQVITFYRQLETVLDARWAPTLARERARHEALLEKA